MVFDYREESIKITLILILSIEHQAKNWSTIGTIPYYLTEKMLNEKITCSQSLGFIL